MSERRLELAFVVPSLAGPVTGGTLFNRELLAALGEHAEVRVVTPDAAATACGASPFVWIDSLFLARVPELAQRWGRPLALFLHYLPSFVKLGRAPSPAELSDEERAALAAVEALWVPSAFMRDALEASVAPHQKIHVLEPGTRARLVSPRGRDQTALRVLCVGNLTPGKGYMELLRALAQVAQPSDDFELSIVGSTTMDADYVAACSALARAATSLVSRVRFVGELSPQATLQELQRADLFVSASLMESYGMALAEARASGVPIAALDGGNVRMHVAQEFGGNLARNHAELAASLLEVARSPARLRERRMRARMRAPRPRLWPDVALEFLGQLEK